MKKILLFISFSFTALFYAQAGNVGINTKAPTEKLDVNGSMRFEPASIVGLAAGQVLVSDENGNASWKEMDLSVKNYGPTYGTKDYTVLNYYDGSATSYPDPTWRYHSEIVYTGTSITLPQGKWLVIFNNIANVQYSSDYTTDTWTDAIPANVALWVRTYFADNSDNYSKGYNHDANVISTNVIGPNKVSNAVVGPSKSMQVGGEQIINNNSGGDKTYYLKVSTQLFNVSGLKGIRLVNFALKGNTASTSENKMIAYRIQ